jgi:hypothetical protein
MEKLMHTCPDGLGLVFLTKHRGCKHLELFRQHLGRGKRNAKRPMESSSFIGFNV